MNGASTISGATPVKFKHVPALDGFRAIAVLIVMFSHAGLKNVIPGGFGVTIFFFLSGYLIISLFRSEQTDRGEISLGGFYFRRTIRIFPPLFLTMGILWLSSISGFFHAPIQASGVLRDGLFLTNYDNFWTTGTGIPIPLWSIDIEEHFYILFSLLFVFFLSKTTPTRAALLCVLLCLLTLCVRLWIAGTGGDIDKIYYWSHTRFDSILFGGCLALWNNPKLDGPGAWRPRIWHVCIAAVVLLLCLFVRDPVFRQTFRYSLQGASLFILFSAALHDDGVVSRVMGSAPLKWVGLLSYTLYLIHLPILHLIEQYAPGLPMPARAFLMILASMAYALGMYFLVEHPLARWRSRRSARLRGVGQPLAGNDDLRAGLQAGLSKHPSVFAR